MNNNEFNIKRQEGTFFTKFHFFISDVSCISLRLQEVIKKYSILEESIIEILLKNKQEGKKEVWIKCCRFNLYELKLLKEVEQIHFLLNFMGCEDKDIRRISCRTDKDNSNKILWVASVSCNFDPKVLDEIREILNFPVDIEIV